MRRAATLAEMLVVIAILAVLLKLLLSVVGAVMGSARQTACMNNLRQVGLAVGLFAGEHGDRLPADGNKGDLDPATSPAWFHRLPPYVDRPDVRGRHTVFQCPVFHWGSPEHFDHASPKSYKMNARLDDDGRPAMPTAIGVPDAAEIVLFADAVAGETGMGQWGHLFPSGLDPSRHDGEVNVLFLDGHGQASVAEPVDGEWEAVLRFESARW